MKRTDHAVIVLGASAIAALLFSAPGASGLIVNLTASIPRGLYVQTSSPPAAGDLVVVALPADVGEIAHHRGYIPRSLPLIKVVAATAGSRVCRIGSRVWIAGGRRVWAERTDGAGRPLPTWQGCRVLRRNEIFLLGTHGLSFDSRYFGPIDRRLIRSSVRPVFIFSTR